MYLSTRKRFADGSPICPCAVVLGIGRLGPTAAVNGGAVPIDWSNACSRMIRFASSSLLFESLSLFNKSCSYFQAKFKLELEGFFLFFGIPDAELTDFPNRSPRALANLEMIDTIASPPTKLLSFCFSWNFFLSSLAVSSKMESDMLFVC